MESRTWPGVDAKTPERGAPGRRFSDCLTWSQVALNHHGFDCRAPWYLTGSRCAGKRGSITRHTLAISGVSRISRDPEDGGSTNDAGYPSTMIVGACSPLSLTP